MAADKGVAGAVAAFDALACAMHEESQAALIELVLRAGSPTKLMLATPNLTNPAHFLLHEVPYKEDVISLELPKLPKIDDAIKKAAVDFVDSMMLSEEAFDPMSTGNPTLHRAIHYFVRRFNDDSFELDFENTWLESFKPLVSDEALKFFKYLEEI